MIAELRDPEHLRSLGAAELSPELIAAVQRTAFARRIMVLELLRREYRSVTDQTSATVVRLIEAWLTRSSKMPSSRSPLTDPFVGIWSEGVLRGDRSLSEAGAVGRLIGAHRWLDEPVELDVELSSGRLHLPAYSGSARLDTEQAVLRADGSRVEVVAGGASVSLMAGEVQCSGLASWSPEQRVTSVADGFSLSVLLSNFDPLSSAVGPSRSIDLSSADGERWAVTIGRAWELVVSRHRRHVAGVQLAANVVVPQHSPDPNRHVSSSNADGFGAVGVSYTEDVATLALGLAHEARHGLLSVVLTEVDLHHEDPTPRFYAGWRPDPRPVEALLQGVCAFAAVTEFWRVEYGAAERADVRCRYSIELQRWFLQTLEAIDQLKNSGLMTAAGRGFVEGLSDLLGSAPEVEPEVALAVDDLIAEHRVVWLRDTNGFELFTFAPLTTLSDAWRTHFFAGNDRPNLHPTDRAIATGQPDRAAAQAWESLAADPADVAAGFRLARAARHLGWERVARQIQALAVSAERPDFIGLIGGPAGERATWPEVAAQLGTETESTDDDRSLVTTAQGATS
ncbi:MAG: hypothetical protein IPH29_09765 [Candidatus Microthrix sp.]|nr:hypothetical protein [Candidatus Microthrix sp.]